MNDIKRMTRQRKKILEVIKNTDKNRHPKANWIYKQVKQNIPNISLGTVYRNLNYLVKEDKIKELNFDDSSTRYDSLTKLHYHFRCTECNKLSNINIDIENLKSINKIKKESKFDIGYHRLEFYGICSDCK